MGIDVYKGMNPEQRVAVGHLKGPLQVIAGAGSGKTRVITHRIANIIQATGTRPDKILAITFTNKSAREMQERVLRLIGLQTPWITTFHSAGLRILKIEAERLGMEHPFTILDEDDQRRLFKDVMKEIKLDAKVLDPRKILHRLSTWKNQLVDIAKVEPNDDLDAWTQKAAAVYARLCHERCHVDFDDLLVRPVQLFQHDPELLKKWQDKFPYILVDEYQDTNAVQYRLLRLLGEHGNICATGDPDQAIYGWRGANIENILNFVKDFPNCTKVLLEQNYRSTKVILRAAQAVVANNQQREAKTIRTDNPEGTPLKLVAVDDEMDESYGIAAACDRMHREGRPWASLAIFYRTNAQSRILEDGLRRRGIPYRIVGGQRFYDREEVKHVLAWCRLLVNPADWTALQRVANVPKRGLGDKALDSLQLLADDVLVTACEVLERDALLERLAVGRNAAPMKELARLWRMLKKLPTQNPSACIRGVLEFTGLEDHYTQTEEEASKVQDRLANMREVISAAEQYQEGFPAGGLGGFLEVVALNTEESREQVGDATDRVTLMTLHAAKGLEFPVVFVTGCEQGVFPLMRGGIIQDLEEERRLMYVGITRAMEELYLSRARSRMMYGQTYRNEPSQFLSEIPSDCFESKDATGRRILPEPTGHMDPRLAKAMAAAKERMEKTVQQAKSSATPAEPFDETDDDNYIEDSLGRIRKKAQKSGPDAPTILPTDPYRPGERVIHSTFGRGTVQLCRGPADRRAIVIEFGGTIGVKELQLAFAASRLSRE